MQISHVFSELGTGLKRNLSMTVSLIVTILVSLVLVGLGLLIQRQSTITEDFFGDRLQLQVILCSDNSVGGTCLEGAANDQQKTAVQQALDTNPEIKSWRYQSPQEYYDKARELYDQSPNGKRLFETIDVQDFPESYFVVLNDPQQFSGITSELSGMSGVSTISSLRDILDPLYEILSKLRWASLGTAGLLIIAAILQVSNTIRLAAYARRREIGIMRLVGASQWHIQLPFLLESLLASLIAGLLACGALAAFMKFVVYGWIRSLRITPWVGWHEAVVTGGLMLVFSLLLALIPTLVMTRKYLDV